MNNESYSNEKGLIVALKLARKQDIHGARVALGIPEEITDNKLIESLMGLDKGLECFRKQKHEAAVEHFQRALPIIEACNDKDAIFVIRAFSQFAEGLSALFSGNAHLATELLNLSSEGIEKISFFIPEFKLTSLSFKAASLIALAKCHVNASDIPSAEKVLGDVRNVSLMSI